MKRLLHQSVQVELPFQSTVEMNTLIAASLYELVLQGEEKSAVDSE